MAKVVIGAEVKVDGLDKAGQSVGALKQRLAEAKKELYGAVEGFGEFSKEAANAAKKVEALKGTMDDAARLVKTFDGDAKFNAFGGAVQGVIGGFTALTGVMGLFGAESKEVEKLLLKVQSAMALSQGLNSVFEGIKGFKDLGLVIKSTTVFQKANNAATVIAATIQRAFGVSVVGTGAAFNVLKAAIIATGIGALVVLIGVIISKMDMFSKKTESAADATDRLAKATDNLNRATKEQIEFYDRVNDLEVKRARIAGATEKEILDIQLAAINKRTELRNQKINEGIKDGLAVSELLKEQLKDQERAEDLKLDFQLKSADAARAAQKVIDDKKIEDDKKLKKEQADALAQFNALVAAKHTEDLDEGLRYQQELKDLDDKAAAAKIQGLYDSQKQLLETKQALAELALLEDPDSIENKIAKTNADFELEMLNFEGNNIQRQVKEKEHAAAIVQIKADEVEAKKKIGEKELEFQNTLASGIANSLDTLAGIAGKQTAAGKALAIASTVIKTIQGGIAAFTGMTSSIPGPVGIALGVVAAAGVVAAGVKAVKQITAVKIPGASSGGSAPSISLPANVPLTPQAQTTRLDQGSINAVGNAANRAYVLETDVSGNQERIRRLNRAARIN